MKNGDSSHIEADGSESGVLRGLKWTHGSIFSRQCWTLIWLSSSLWGCCEYLIVICSSQADLVPWFFALDHSNSATGLAISGPATIHLGSAEVCGLWAYLVWFIVDAKPCRDTVDLLWQTVVQQICDKSATNPQPVYTSQIEPMEFRHHAAVFAAYGVCECADYALATSSRYVNIQVGIKDRRVFDVPTQCRRPSGPQRMMTSHDVRPD